jgi:small subunit ribosomal protein S20
LPNIASAKKRMRQAVKRHARNRAATSTARNYIHRAHAEIAKGPGETTEATVKLAIRALDKAAKKGIIHKNNAARRKSRLMRRLNAALAPKA